MISWPTFITFSQKGKKMIQSMKKPRRKMIGMMILLLRMKTTNQSKIRQTHILRLLDKDINSSGEQEETTRSGKELQDKPPTSSLTGMNLTPKDQLQIPIPKPRKCLRSTRTTQISTGQSKHL